MNIAIGAGAVATGMNNVIIGSNANVQIAQIDNMTTPESRRELLNGIKSYLEDDYKVELHDLNNHIYLTISIKDLTLGTITIFRHNIICTGQNGSTKKFEYSNPQFDINKITSYFKSVEEYWRRLYGTYRPSYNN